MTDHQGAGLSDRGIHVVDGIVCRPRGYWTEAVHDLLRWLADVGFDLSPTPSGLDEQFEYVQFIPGDDLSYPLLPFIQSLEGAHAAGAFARQLESVLAAYEPDRDARWQLPERAHSHGPIAHGDLGPWNLLWDTERGEICGLIDWDLAGPAPFGYDAGFLAWQMIPVMDDDRASTRGFAIPVERAARFAAYCDGYGASSREVLDLVIATQEEFCNRVISASNSGPPIYSMLKKRNLADPVSEDRRFAQIWRETIPF